jgi:hypothetical protein
MQMNVAHLKKGTLAIMVSNIIIAQHLPQTMDEYLHMSAYAQCICTCAHVMFTHLNSKPLRTIESVPGFSTNSKRGIESVDSGSNSVPRTRTS